MVLLVIICVGNDKFIMMCRRALCPVCNSVTLMSGSLLSLVRSQSTLAGLGLTCHVDHENLVSQ